MLMRIVPNYKTQQQKKEKKKKTKKGIYQTKLKKAQTNKPFAVDKAAFLFKAASPNPNSLSAIFLHEKDKSAQQIFANRRKPIFFSYD
jgi:hypothetical protein